MENCRICGFLLKNDLFSAVIGEAVCSICKLRFIGGLPTTEERIIAARDRLGLKEGEFLRQNNEKEASRILGKKY